jgi:hypothetical protein
MAARRGPLRKMEDPDSGRPIPVKVDPEVMRAARAAMREGQRIVVMSANEVRIVNQ